MTAATPPEVDLTLSTQGHSPEVDLTLSRKGHQSKNEFTFLKRRPSDSCNPPLKLTWHFQNRGTSPRMKSSFEKETE